MDDGSATWEKRTFIEVYVQYEKHSNNYVKVQVSIAGIISDALV